VSRAASSITPLSFMLTSLSCSDRALLGSSWSMRARRILISSAVIRRWWCWWSRGLFARKGERLVRERQRGGGTIFSASRLLLPGSMGTRTLVVRCIVRISMRSVVGRPNYRSESGAKVFGHDRRVRLADTQAMHL